MLSFVKNVLSVIKDLICSIEFKIKDNQKKGVAFNPDNSICDACTYNDRKK